MNVKSTVLNFLDSQTKAMKQEHTVYVKLIHFLLGVEFSFKSLIVIELVNKFTATENEYSLLCSYHDLQLNTVWLRWLTNFMVSYSLKTQ
jgi:hypothetical protein